MKFNKAQLISAAVAGVVTASISMKANAEGAAKADPKESGPCYGANACKGKGACNQKDHDCAGKNACKGKGWVDKTKAECDALAKKDKNVKFKFQG